MRDNYSVACTKMQNQSHVLALTHLHKVRAPDGGLYKLQDYKDD